MSFTTFSRHRHFGHSFSKPLKDNIITQPECPPSPPLPQTTLSQPRFSVFGKKAKFNVVSPINDTTTTTPIKPTSTKMTNNTPPSSIEEASPTCHHQPKRLVKKFEFLTQAKSTNVLAANQQEKRLDKEMKEKQRKEEQERLTNPNYFEEKKKKKSVHFDPYFLESVCLFTEEQEPIQLKPTHPPRLRLICPYWPKRQNNDILIVNKKWLSINSFAIKGRILVRNLALDKSVNIRYTLDAWNTVSDVDGWFFGPYLKNPAYDVYEFTMDLWLPDRGEMRGKLEFVMRLTADNADYWDNNHGKNYHIRIIADPLNDDQSSDDEEEEKFYREEDATEKHSSFSNALKGYQHASPLHLRKTTPSLGSRYDFGHSLSLAKRRGSHTSSDEEEEGNDDFFIKSPPPSFDLLLTPSSSTEVKPVFINHSAPPSPLMSPIMDVDSTSYTDLLNKYCFYNGDTTTSQQSQQNSYFPIQS